MCDTCEHEWDPPEFADNQIRECVKCHTLSLSMVTLFDPKPREPGQPKWRVVGTTLVEGPTSFRVVRDEWADEPGPVQ